MKTIGWLITLIGSNFLTATIVAKSFYKKLDDAVNEVISNASDWMLNSMSEFVGNAIDNAIGGIPIVGMLAGTVGELASKKIGESVSDFILGFHGISENIDIEGRTRVNVLFFVALAIFIGGVAVLITAYVKEAMNKSDKSESDS